MVKNTDFEDLISKTISFVINRTIYPISITKDKDNYYISSNINILTEDFKYRYKVKDYIIKNYNNAINGTIINI